MLRSVDPFVLSACPTLPILPEPLERVSLLPNIAPDPLVIMLPEPPALRVTELVVVPIALLIVMEPLLELLVCKISDGAEILPEVPILPLAIS